MDTCNMFLAFALLHLLPLLLTLPINTNAQKLQKLHKIPITCDAGSFVDGHYGSVTCNFHKVMQVDKRGINVVLHALNAPDNDLGTDVLACEWKETLLKYHCIVGEGYTFDHDISDRLTVGISAVGEEFKGLYMCFIVPSEETDKHGCELKIKDSKTQTTPDYKGKRNYTQSLCS
ncbi:uncharacterized protein [Littorina saxatilis]|uniref:uncharacterized protein n=1 Tax=Littorina saxatilis TaxID=31220 RepID=UPI0038B664DD